MPVRLNICLFGPTHCGKTSLLGTLAQSLYEQRGLKTRLYSGDGGGWAPMQHLVDADIVDAWDLSEHIYPFETVNNAVRGAWPVDKADPKSVLRPLYLNRWRTLCVKCGNGGPPKLINEYVVNQPTNAICPTCKGILTVEQFRQWVNDNRRAARAAIAKAKGK